jgi:hypothetical protein
VECEAFDRSSKPCRPSRLFGLRLFLAVVEVSGSPDDEIGATAGAGFKDGEDRALPLAFCSVAAGVAVVVASFVDGLWTFDSPTRSLSLWALLRSLLSLSDPSTRLLQPHSRQSNTTSFSPGPRFPDVLVLFVDSLTQLVRPGTLGALHLGHHHVPGGGRSSSSAEWATERRREMGARARRGESEVR